MGEGLVCTPAGVVVSVDLIKQKTYQPAYLLVQALASNLSLSNVTMLATIHLS